MKIVFKDNARKTASSSSLLHVALYDKIEADKYTSSSSSNDNGDVATAGGAITLNEMIVKDGYARVSKK